ncbi:hypothetical protein Tco_1405241 [Tanacetum coccineum]
MVVLESCPKHNMVAYLEKTDGNAEFHEIIDFLARSSIHNALTEDSGGNHKGQSSSDRSLLGNEGGMTLQSVYDLCISLCTQVTDQAKEIKHLKAQIKKLKKKAKHVITHHRAWMKSVSMKQRLTGKKSLKTQWMQKESVSKQGRKFAKAEPSVHKDPAFDELDDDEIDHIETEDVQDAGRIRYVLLTREKVSTDRPDEGTVDQTEGRSATPTPTPTIFGDDETITQVLLNMSQAKAVSREIGGKGDLALRLQKEERGAVNYGRKKPKFLHDTLRQEGFWQNKEMLPSETDPPSFKISAQESDDALLNMLETRNIRPENKLLKKYKLFMRKNRKIKEMNEGASDPDKKKKVVKEDVLTKEPAKQEVVEQGIKKRKGGHMKMLARKRKRPQPDVDSDDEHRKLNNVSSQRMGGRLSCDYQRPMGNFRHSTMSLQELKDEAIIYMLVERRYHLSKDLLQRMLALGLEVERESTATLDLIRFIKQQIDEKVFNSPCFMVKSWLVQDQTISSKDYSNLLIVDSLVKSIWFINAPSYGNEALASPKANELTIPEQTATGKGISNPFMADSAYTISIHSQCFSIVNLYLYKLAITLSRLKRSVQFGTHTTPLKIAAKIGITSWWVLPCGRFETQEPAYRDDLTDGYPSLFFMRIHHGGYFTDLPRRKYVNGKENIVDASGIEEFSVYEVDSIMKQLGYNETVEPIYYHFLIPRKDLDVGLEALGNEDDVLNFSKYVAIPNDELYNIGVVTIA